MNDRIISATSAQGTPVTNSHGEDLGKIEDIMLDNVSGEIRYAVLSFGGFLGMGDKLFAVPWKALVIDRDKKEFHLNVDKELLQRAPGFDKENWPDFSNAAFTTPVNRHYSGVGAFRYAS